MAGTLMRTLDQELRQRLGVEALLQRFKRIRCQESPTRPLSMATSTMVKTSLACELRQRQCCVIPTTKR